MRTSHRSADEVVRAHVPVLSPGMWARYVEAALCHIVHACCLSLQGACFCKDHVSSQAYK